MIHYGKVWYGYGKYLGMYIHVRMTTYFVVYTT